ncbi:MAG TPA: DNA polymerase ligase N-terminal domain-containing protein [Candidatus Rhabdochlamydia sp.]|jgi:bifunctional non-homologous end joining protein LigD|nr:DNA polymerase ligase N-terminal domain-containing protein [Candidatus Rhabdochlamydia sp.]
MSLKEYRAKRNLKKSSEPSSGKKHTGFLRFCVQKHAARHLHYDFRLEYRGALLSFAVPKGPSMNPKIKRLAIKVEDHPLDYQYFEGVIPKGNYGAGTVKIWDHGFYTSSDATEPKKVEKILSQGLKKGHFTVIVKGKKIKGEFVFQKLKTDKDNTWLLMKKADEYASS